jgi:AraC-like DNA-binding protein
LIRELTSGISGSYQGVPEFPEPVIHDPLAAKKLANLFLSIEANDDSLQIESMFVSVMSAFITEYSTRKTPVEPIQSEHSGVRRTRDYLCENYANEITLENLSQISGLSSFHLLRSFRKAYGLPPFAFLMNLRIENARQLLRKGWDISDVAQETGFYDQSHLNRNFVRITGITPGKYRAISSKKSFGQYANLSL